MTMDVSEQLEAVHRMARRRHMQWLTWISLALAAVLAVLGLCTRQPPYFLLVLLAVLVAGSAHRTGPHVRAASQAVSLGRRSEGLVDIEVEQSSDSDRFHATAGVDSTHQWRFEFIPLGWKPVAGRTRATLYTLRDLDWPALVEVQDGVMYPRDTPEQVSS